MRADKTCIGGRMNQNQNQNPNHTVRKITLPSGRNIEVIRFERTKKPARAGLHICPDCESDLVQPLAWSEPLDGGWELELSCPNCRWNTEGVFSQEEVYELEDRLDEGLEDMLRDLKRLTHANMVEEIDRFVVALNANHILPEDF
ncbi:MAG: hypothetical protein JOZ98_22235 [Solirubrobacterales bacterium]|nr:hypothetical protein [Solirubrobacterales bacterium]